MPLPYTSSGVISTVTELVGYVTSGAISTVTQSVSLSLTSEGVISTVTQTTSSTTSGVIANITERVYDPTAPSFFKRNGWDVSVHIGGLDITSMITGDVKISKASNVNTIVDLKLLVADPVAFIDVVYDGTQQIIIDYFDGTNVYRLVTALVDSPDIDILNRTVTLRCSNQRKDLVNSKLPALVKTIGIYSPQVHGTFNSVLDELNLRLKTVAADVDFDSYNNYNLNYWQAKSVADFTFTGADVYQRTPKIVWQNRADIINTMDISLKYKRTRLYYYQLAYDWTASYYGNPTDYATNLYSSPTTDLVNSAIDKTTWKKLGDASFTQVYTLVAGWFGLGYSSTVITFTDSSGATVTDAKGDTLYQAIPPATRKTINVMKADWQAAIKFSQFIEEDYNITVQAPQSVNKNKTVIDYIAANYEDSYDATSWEAFPNINAPKPAGAVTSNNSYYVDVPESSPGTLNTALLACINMGAVNILRTHRGTLVTLQCGNLKPQVELSHTVAFNCSAVGNGPAISCKGKVVKIDHTFNTDGDRETEITIALYRVPSSASATPVVLPARPSYVPSIPTGTVVLGNHYGVIPVTGTATDAWNGFIGTIVQHVNIGFDLAPYTIRPQFTDEFRVDTPAIPDNLRALYPLQVNASYDIVIPNDTLTIGLSV